MNVLNGILWVGYGRVSGSCSDAQALVDWISLHCASPIETAAPIRMVFAAIHD